MMYSDYQLTWAKKNKILLALLFFVFVVVFVFLFKVVLTSIPI